MASSFFKSPGEPSSDGESSPVVDDEDTSRKDQSQQSPRTNPRRSQSRRPANSTRALSRISSSVHVPNIAQLDAQQRMNLFNLSLMEGRCITQAAKSLNESRPSDQQLSEDDPEVQAAARELFESRSQALISAGLLSGDYAGPESAGIRAQFLERFDSMLQGNPTRSARGLEQSDGLVDVSVGNIMQSPTSSTISIPPNALVRTTSTLTSQIGPAPAMILGQRNPFLAPDSTYNREYQQICMLGKGGYGTVYKARNHLDNQDYAIKKILISSQRLQKIRDTAQIDALLAELRTLAKLNHPNTVRYYHGWIETSTGEILSSIRPDEQLLLDSESLMMSQLHLQDGVEVGAIDSDDLALPTIEKNSVPSDDGIIFGYSSSKDLNSSLPKPIPRRRSRRESHATTSSARSHKTSIQSVGDETSEIAQEFSAEEDLDVESIPRSFTGPSNFNHAKAREALAQKHDLPRYMGPDVTLFIKMSLHQSNLANYLYPETDSNGEPRHCFHLEPTIGLLKSLLDGIDYLHSQRIVHRDLKPANIFLSVQRGERPLSATGFVDIAACKSCVRKDRTPIYLTPCIGDFGLIAEMKDGDDLESKSCTSAIYESSALAKLAPKPVGTQFYRPQKMPTREPIICEKLDVYSLGVITFEMLWKFGTKTERAMVLSQLNSTGALPDDFADEEVIEGIRAMVNEDRDARWGCKEVRSWLDDLEKRIVREDA